jgi:hypothetical protein
MNYKNLVMTIFSAVILVLATATVFAIDIPMGAETLIEGWDGTLNASQLSVSTHEAYAGNITEINLTGRSQTKRWQGYYGDITGTITLDDAQNWTMYDWYNPEPRGEIFATVDSTAPDWQSIACFNYQGRDDSPNNLTYWEIYYNMSPNTVDGIDETFNMFQHPLFSVGAYTIMPNNCSSTFTYVNSEKQTDKFSEVLLTDSAGQLIFTTIIENDDYDPNDGTMNNTDPIGFDSRAHDFQMLVAEDGTSIDPATSHRNTNPTTYYFYIDIE